MYRKQAARMLTEMTKFHPLVGLGISNVKKKFHLNIRKLLYGEIFLKIHGKSLHINTIFSLLIELKEVQPLLSVPCMRTHNL
jgi:hypothetical protein